MEKMFLLVMRPLRIYSLHIFPTYHTAVLAIVSMLHTTSLVLFICNWKFVLFGHLPPILPPPSLVSLLNKAIIIFIQNFLCMRH